MPRETCSGHTQRSTHGRVSLLIMTSSTPFRELLQRAEPILALAPMQAVTDLPFWTLMARHGGPDVYFTEYFRVHSTSRLHKDILRSITENPTGRPAVAQMIGNDIEGLVRTARELQQYPVAGIDLNLGCPAPVVYRKRAGGGLLREPQLVDAILGALREAVSVCFSVKTRIGFDSPDVFEELLPIFARHNLDLVTVHGRTVLEMYRSEVHYDHIQRAAEALPCPVLANGNVHSAVNADAILQHTGARGWMIGRGAIRNPWIFEQIRQHRRGESVTFPTGREVLTYIEALYETVCSPDVSENAQVQRIKKHMNFLGLGVDEEGRFLQEIRRTDQRNDFFRICRDYLDHDRPMSLEPHAPAPA